MKVFFLFYRREEMADYISNSWAVLNFLYSVEKGLQLFLSPKSSLPHKGFLIDFKVGTTECTLILKSMKNGFKFLNEHSEIDIADQSGWQAIWISIVFKLSVNGEDNFCCQGGKFQTMTMHNHKRGRKEAFSSLLTKK